MTNYDPIDEALNVKSEIIPTPEMLFQKKNEIKKDEGQKMLGKIMITQEVIYIP